MTSQPSLFIGSSSESLEYAYALQQVLDHDLVTTVWPHGVFAPGGMTLTSLLDRARTTDFAALFLTPDDESIVRGEYLKTPRDNMLFELGLCIGQLGPQRAFLLHPRERVDLPSDLQGVTPLTYRTDREDQDIQNAVGSAATGIRTAVKRLGRRQAPELPASSPGRGPSPELLLALTRLGVAAAKSAATLEVNVIEANQVEVVTTDRTRLGTSVVVDVGDAAAAAAVDHLIERLTAR
ncbi:MAG TPA: TIR domain-containing protein [Conexibacter sp.]|nr:TIR domain-containing protein [Conexibacter sp.]